MTMEAHIHPWGAMQHQLGPPSGPYWALKAPFWAYLHFICSLIRALVLENFFPPYGSHHQVSTSPGTPDWLPYGAQPLRM